MGKDFLCEQVAKLIFCLGYLSHWNVEGIQFAKRFSKINLVYHLKLNYSVSDLIDFLDYLVNELDEVPVRPVTI
ncbi:hypothetical protein WN865_01170 [Tetragenococcus halophilus]